jgi:hypothetical protein
MQKLFTQKMADLEKKSDRYKKKTKKRSIHTRLKKGANKDHPDGDTVLFWRGKGSSESPLECEVNFARFLESKGLRSEFVFCDGVLSGCINMNVFTDKKQLTDENKNIPFESWQDHCAACYGTGKTLLKASGMPYHQMSKWISDEEEAQIRDLADSICLTEMEDFNVDGVPVGDIALTGVLRYFRSQHTGRNLDTDDVDPYLEKAMREYFYSALIGNIAAKKAIQEIKPKYIFLIRGTYPLFGPVVYHGVKNDIPVMVWTYAYSPETVFVRMHTPDDAFMQCQSPQKKHWDMIKQKELTKKEQTHLNAFMTNRINKLSKSPWFYDSDASFGKDFASPNSIRKELNIPNDKKVWMIGAQTNWDWDSFLEEVAIFRDPVQWLIKTFEIVIKNKDVFWIFRPHPAEIPTNTARLSKDIVADIIGELPDNVKILTSENSDLNTYSLFPLIDGAVTMCSTVGLELSLYGKPVVIGGDAFYGHRGFTYNPETLKEYEETLMNVQNIELLSTEQIKLAERYVYDFWLCRQIPFRKKKNNRFIKNNPIFENIYQGMVNSEQIRYDPPFDDVDNPDKYDWKNRLENMWR